MSACAAGNGRSGMINDHLPQTARFGVVPWIS